MKKEILAVKYRWFSILLILQFSCISSQENAEKVIEKSPESAKVVKEVALGNEQSDAYFPLIKNKRIAFVGNHTSLIKGQHLVDSLLKGGFNIVKVFSPEHGFRGLADAGEKVNNEIDPTTSLPIISLYGSNKKPKAVALKDVDVILFDIQDVGARFYTYISTLHYVMEAAAENKIPVVVLDRPNPNGHYVDGPVLQKQYKSFVGMHPVPVVHGMTIGEYAKMINGEGWLKGKISCDLTVISCKDYDHSMRYALTVPPSPNLPTMRAVYLYPSLCFFEGTPVSIGRGTDFPFQQIGHPSLTNYVYSFVPKPSFGSKSPKLKNEMCLGINLSVLSVDHLKKEKFLKLNYLLEFYDQFQEKELFFTEFFNLLAGNNRLQAAIKSGKSEAEIRKLWEAELKEFKQLRAKYLLYPDFD
jgi:uncharacterized protein YbbC (DUF1343 family)